MHRELDFTISEGPIYWRTHRIMELCDYLTSNVLERMFTREGKRWDRRFMDFFTFDNSCDPLEPTGIIRLTVPPWFAGRVRELENAITQELAKLRIKAGPFEYEHDPVLRIVKTIRISITENPTALTAAPDVNMSRTWGYVVLRDLLGYQWIDGRYEFTAHDLVERVSAVTEDEIAASTASPVKSAEGLRRTPSPIGMKAVRRCLDEVKQFGLWALNHNHRKLAAV
jgi:hypothetical protein